MAIATPAAPMQDAPDPALIAASLQSVWQQPLAVTQLQRLTAGATKQTWLLDVTMDAAVDVTADKAIQGATQQQVQRLILQTLPLSKLQSMDCAVQRTLTPAQDTRITQLAHAQGVPVPELVLQLDGSQGIGHGQITRFVAGETLAPKILRDARFAQAREQLTAHCAQALAKIHRIPATAAAFLPAKDARSQWLDERAQVDASGVLHPALEWGLRWVNERLEERLDDHGQRTATPVHGDFRLGNLIVNESGLAAVIDWELAHLGDPMQDLAWLCLRTWRFGGPGEVAGIGRRADLFTHYEQAGGQAVDEARVFFWEMACQVRWAVMCLGMGLGTGQGAVSLEHTLIGRRMVEPLWDMIRLAKTRGDAA